MALHTNKKYEWMTLFSTVDARRFGGRVLSDQSCESANKVDLGERYFWYLDVLAVVRRDVPLHCDCDAEMALSVIGS